MLNRLKNIEAALFRRAARPPQGRVERTCFWSLALFGTLTLFSYLPGGVGSFSGGLGDLALTVFLVCGIVLSYRWLTSSVLWTVRNRLIVTYLLMGLAPVVLLVTIAGIAAYAFTGQFAIDTAQQSIQEALRRADTTASVVGTDLLHKAEAASGEIVYGLPVITDTTARIPGRDAMAVWYNGRRLPLRAQSRQPYAVLAAGVPDAQVPPWLREEFRGIVRFDHRLYLCSSSKSNGDKGMLVSVTFAPLDTVALNDMAQDLGNISVVSEGLGDYADDAASGRDDAFTGVHGGTLPAAMHFYDLPVYFGGRIEITDWQTGKRFPAVLGVVSRVHLLYGRLFATSAQFGAFVRYTLIAIGVLFSLLELLALFLAIRLSRIITRSVADLYAATVEIDRGNLAHRIPVERKDQLAALATSFNTMSGSLEHLLEQQREKERIQSELAIAQEVQNNLFPHIPIQLPAFELFGVCKPARSVSGDYYDFIHAGDEVCLALGDISGKGISAALLMASLHSAVRAYHSTGEAVRVAAADSSCEGEGTSPSKLLELLNRQLYTSTQPEKYATLFLACYSSSQRTLTYSNGGQLPPFILRDSGEVERLTCGGSVVGLLQHLSYRQACVKLAPGDLFVAYSDGVTEPENEFGEFGEERLLAVVQRHRHRSLSAISDEAMRALHSWIGTGEQPDDITLVLARQL